MMIMNQIKFILQVIVVNKFCEKPSNWRSIKSLEEFLIENDVIAISDVDTREITTILREKGAMNCCIGSMSKSL